jgi:TRAP-type mannitol/chloroaromatic compound transport system permease large subunit
MSFTAVFSALDGRQIITKYIGLLGLSPLATLILILTVEFLLGMFLDPIAILLILIPVAVPISANMGWDPLWFGMLLCVTMQTAWLSPPFGYALFFLRGLNLPKIEFSDIAKGALQFIVLQVIGVGLCIAFPQIILWLPNLLID